MTGQRWTLRGAHTEYTVTVPAHGRWLELVAWGPHGVSDGPSPVAYDGPVPFLTTGDAAPIEYATDADRPFTGADLVVETSNGQRRVGFVHTDARVDADQRELAVAFADPVTGLRATVHYQVPAGTDVVQRWVELTNDGSAPLRVVRAGSGGFCVPTSHGALLSHQWGQWAQEFQLSHVELGHGTFSIGSSQGVPGHLHVPWLAVRDTADPAGSAWGMGLAWTGSWEISAERDTGGLTRVRAGRHLVDGPLELASGESLTLPVVTGAYSPEGLDGLARVWHTHQRLLAGERLTPRPVLYNSWEATYFTVEAESQLALARIAAELGVETFVVDDGWFVGRNDDTAGLGDWTPDPAKFPAGFDAFIADVRALGLNFGLWVEPECVNPKSTLYAEHPDWVYSVDGRPITPVRNQYLLDLGRPEVAEFVHSTVDGLLRRYDIDYLKWDFNRPRTEPGRPGGIARSTWTVRTSPTCTASTSNCVGTTPACLSRPVPAVVRGPTWRWPPGPTSSGPATTPAPWTGSPSSTASCTPTHRTCSAPGSPTRPVCSTADRARSRSASSSRWQVCSASARTSGPGLPTSGPRLPTGSPATRRSGTSSRTARCT